MLIPACKAYKTEYSNDVMLWCGNHMKGYRNRAIPSVDAAHAQPACTRRNVSQIIKLTGRRSTRAAISPGMTTLLPPTALEVSCAIAALLAAIWCQGAARAETGKGSRFALGLELLEVRRLPPY